MWVREQLQLAGTRKKSLVQGGSTSQWPEPGTAGHWGPTEARSCCPIAPFCHCFAYLPFAVLLCMWHPTWLCTSPETLSLSSPHSLSSYPSRNSDWFFWGHVLTSHPSGGGRRPHSNMAARYSGGGRGLGKWVMVIPSDPFQITFHLSLHLST